MGSSYGKRRGLPGYDEMRTGFTYRDVQSMLWSADPDPATWKYKRRGTVLGLFHQIKMEQYEEMMRREEEAEREGRRVSKAAG